MSANIVDLKSGRVGFNKTIDGGFELGYAISSEITLGIFYEVQHFRQLRDPIAEAYAGSPIPNGNNGEVFNAVDTSDNDLFRDKALQSISLKLVFNLTSL